MKTIKMGAIRKGGALACVGTLSLALFAASAHAATPGVQGCLGSTFAPLASYSKSADPGLFGQGAASAAQSQATGQPGLGAAIQLVQAGQVPDDVLPNTCND